MSFSFSVKGNTKDDVKAKVRQQMEEVVNFQTIHAKDKPIVEATADAFIDLIEQDENRDIEVFANGSLGWVGDVNTGTIVSTGLTVNVGLRDRV